MEQEHLYQETWDKRKILFVISFLLLLAGGVFWFKEQGFQLKAPPSKKMDLPSTPKDVLGEQTPDLPLPSKQVLEEKLQVIKEQVGDLSITDIASSSPQVQKILKDIQTLQDYPRNQAKEACLNVCNSF